MHSPSRPSRRRFSGALLALGSGLALPAAAEVVIHLANGQTVKLPYTRGEVARIEFTGEGQAMLPGDPAVAGSAPLGTRPVALVPLGPGTPWVVNAQGAIFRRIGGAWQQTDGAARDIGVGADGTAWVIGVEAVPGGRAIYRLGGNGWNQVDGGGERIAVAPDGQPWVVTQGGAVQRRVGQRWQTLPGAARDIGVGADGSVWAIGLDPAPGGHGIYRWVGERWTRVDGGGVRIAVGPDGQPWVINSAGAVLRRVGNRWQQLPGVASDIGVGSDGTAWIIDRDADGGNAGILHWDGQNWQRVEGMAQAIAVR
jgi:Tectonin domain